MSREHEEGTEEARTKGGRRGGREVHLGPVWAVRLEDREPVDGTGCGTVGWEGRCGGWWDKGPQAEGALDEPAC